MLKYCPVFLSKKVVICLIKKILVFVFDKLPSGLHYSAIALEFNVKGSTVHYIQKKWKDTHQSVPAAAWR